MKRLVLLVLLLGNVLLADVIGVVPSTLTVSPGSAFTLSIDVSDISDLYAFQFDLGFSPDILSATSVTSGSFVNWSFFPGFIDNATGTISFIADSLAGPPPGVSGSGTLATVGLLAVGEGTTPITLSNIILLDSNLADIAADAANGSVTVSAVPEPASALLVVSVVMLMLAVSKVRNRTVAKP